jgi:hypothetical protein
VSLRRAKNNSPFFDLALDRYRYRYYIKSIAGNNADNGRKEKMKKLNTGDNESLVKGVFANNDGTFTAVTFTQSKTFKTAKGENKWMSTRS